MGFRIRKTFTIMPGLKINLSKSGFSTSVGKKGSMINLSTRGTKTTVGIPGTGFGYQTSRKKGVWPFLIAVGLFILVLLLLGNVFSN